MPKKKQSGGRRKPPSGVIHFPVRPEAVDEFSLRRGRKPAGDIDVVIHQEKLEVERILRENLLWRYLEYQQVEPGARTIMALQVSTEPRTVKGSSFYRLKVT